MNQNFYKAFLAFFFVISIAPFINAQSQILSADSDEKKSIDYQIQLQSPQLAARGDVLLTFAELEAFLSTIPEERRGPFLADPERFTQALSNQLDVKHMAKDAIDNGLDRGVVVQARLLTAVWRELAQIFQEEYLADAELNDYSSRANELYLSNPDRYRRPQRLSFSHVLLSSEKYSEPLARQALAEELVSNLRAGAEFSRLAREHSDDQSVAANNGTIQNIPADRLDPEFREQVEKLDIGQIDIVQSSHGTHVVRLDARNEAGIPPFDEA